MLIVKMFAFLAANHQFVAGKILGAESSAGKEEPEPKYLEDVEQAVKPAVERLYSVQIPSFSGET